MTDALGYDVKSGSAFRVTVEFSLTSINRRRPAYTDRILYLHSPSIDIQQTTYTSHPEITMSDHRPVSANFRIGIWNVDGQSYYRRARELARRLGHYEESEEVPHFSVSASELPFGDIRYA